MINWENCRTGNGKELNLVDVFMEKFDHSPDDTQYAYLRAIMNTHPISSRQVAAKCVIDCIYMCRGKG